MLLSKVLNFFYVFPNFGFVARAAWKSNFNSSLSGKQALYEDNVHHSLRPPDFYEIWYRDTL